MSVAVILIVLFLAYSNGANDNFKGVATLYGGGICAYRRALAWGTIATFVGSLTAVMVAEKFLQSFGAGLREDASAVGIAAALTVFAATLFALPVSTTHALVGATIGTAVVSGHNIDLGGAAPVILIPLLVSPVVAFAFSGLAFRLARGIETSSRFVTVAHFLGAGAVSFSRGFNDTPKIAFLLLAGGRVNAGIAVIAVGAAMALGGIVHSRAMAETLGRRIAPMDSASAAGAGFVTAFLVVASSCFGFPVSTTHVSCGSLFGIGAATDQTRWKTVVAIIGAWLVTLPAAGILAAGIVTIA